MNIEYVKVGELQGYEFNTRTHSDEQVDQLAASIGEFGFTNPLLIDGERQIIAGHGRLAAATKIGMDEVPCIVLDHLSEAQRRAYVIADNKLALNAGWDEDLLKLELSALDQIGFDLSVVGFDADEIELLLDEDSIDEDGLIGDDEVPDLLKDNISKQGDVWLLDNHRVMCGDSTSLDDVNKLVGSGVIDCCWTDPPYNVNYESKAGKIENDNMSNNEFRKFLFDAFACALDVMREGAPMYIAHADTEGYNFRGAFIDAGFKLSGCLIWVKNALVLGRSDYQWRHEPILYGWKPGAAHSWYGARNKTTVINAKDMPYIISDDGSVQIDVGGGVLNISGENLQVEELVGTTIHAEKPKRNGEHPTMKPVDLVLGMIKNSSKRGDTVLDLFGGSGTTMIACQKSGRKSCLMEFDPRYCDVIVKRWQEYTGKQAVHSVSGLSFNEVADAKQVA